MKRVIGDSLLAVKSATFAVAFTRRGTRTADAGGRSGEARRGTMGGTTAAFPGAVQSGQRMTLFRAPLLGGRRRRRRSRPRRRMGVLPSSAPAEQKHCMLPLRREEGKDMNRMNLINTVKNVQMKISVRASWDVFLRISPFWKGITA